MPAVRCVAVVNCTALLAPKAILEELLHVACGGARVRQQVLVPHWRVLLGRLFSLVQVFLRS